MLPRIISRNLVTRNLAVSKARSSYHTTPTLSSAKLPPLPSAPAEPATTTITPHGSVTSAIPKPTVYEADGRSQKWSDDDPGHDVQGAGHGRHTKRTLASLSMDGKVCVVTGAGRGLGNMMARTFVES